MINRGGCFFEAFDDDNEDDEDALQMRLDGGGEFNGVEADWFAFKSLAVAENDLASEIAELVEKTSGAVCSANI